MFNNRINLKYRRIGNKYIDIEVEYFIKDLWIEIKYFIKHIMQEIKYFHIGNRYLFYRLYEFDELKEEVKKKVLDKFRDIPFIINIEFLEEDFRVV